MVKKKEKRKNNNISIWPANQRTSYRKNNIDTDLTRPRFRALNEFWI